MIQTFGLIFAIFIASGYIMINKEFQQQKYVQEFEKFIIKFDKQYESQQQMQIGFQNFIQNFQKLQQIETDAELTGVNVELGINQYFDISISEFNQNILMPATQVHDFDQNRYRYIPQDYLNNKNQIPNQWDWRDHGAVTKVYNQGTVGSCWAFSAVQNVEGQWKLSGHDLIELSTEQLVECDNLTNPPNAACGIFGGWPYLGLQYIQEIGGVASNKEYRYCVGIPKKQNPCRPCSPPGFDEKLCGHGLKPPSCDDKRWPCKDKSTKFVAHIDSWEALSSDEEILKKQIYEIGPISVLMNAQWLSFYKKGIWNPRRCSSKSLNHAVLIVGYGTEEGQDYWLVKNTWGEKWGENGYFRIVRGQGKCGINKQPVSAVINKKQQTKNTVQEIFN